MEQYYNKDYDIVLSKTGAPIKVSSGRKRVKYTSVGTALVRDKEAIRVDLLAVRLVADIRNVGRMIDCNEGDLFSLALGDKVYFARGV